MHRIHILTDLDQECFMKDSKIKHDKKIKRNKDKTIKIDDRLFDIALHKGLIEKTDDGYLFIGDYRELLAFRKRRTQLLRQSHIF